VARTYGVVTGDTLPKLAERFYGDSTRFPLIAAANGIVNPALITAGQLLAIPEALGGVSIRRRDDQRKHRPLHSAAPRAGQPPAGHRDGHQPRAAAVSETPN
jgi:LysM repeat protein